MDDLFTLFTVRLDGAGIDSMVTGGVASIIYGEQRPTHGVDLVVTLDDASVAMLVQAFPADEFHVPPTELIRLEARRPARGRVVLVHRESGFRADLYVIADDPLHAWAIARTRRVMFGELALQLAPAEYVILRKLEYYREGGGAKHLEDICAILRSSPEAIDAAELGRMIATRGLAPEWAEIEATAAI